MPNMVEYKVSEASYAISNNHRYFDKVNAEIHVGLLTSFCIPEFVHTQKALERYYCPL